MKLYSKVIAIGITAAIAAAMPGISSANEYYRGGSVSTQVVVRDNDVAPVLAVLVGGLVIASAIHASSRCEPVWVAAPVCPPRYDVYEPCGRGWNDDRDWNDDCDRDWHRHGRGHGRWHERGWERHGH